MFQQSCLLDNVPAVCILNYNIIYVILKIITLNLQYINLNYNLECGTASLRVNHKCINFFTLYTIFLKNNDFVFVNTAN